jgi:hypothetical protein
VRLSEYLRNFPPGDPVFQFEQTSLRIDALLVGIYESFVFRSLLVFVFEGGASSLRAMAQLNTNYRNNRFS